MAALERVTTNMSWNSCLYSNGGERLLLGGLGLSEIEAEIKDPSSVLLVLFPGVIQRPYCLICHQNLI